MMNKNQHLSTSDYDRLLLHALSSEEQVKIEQHLVVCERCRTDHADYAADARQFSQEIFPRTVQRLRLATPGSFWGRLLQQRVVWILAPAMTAVLALVVVRGRLSDDGHRGSRSSAGDAIRIKGGEPTLRSFARRMQHVFPIQDGMELHPGDEMRFVVDSPRLQFLLLASVDGAGRVNIYFPYDGSQSGVIATGKPTELPGSIVLDTAPGPERVFAFYSKNPLLRAELEPVLKSLGASGPAAIRAKKLLPVKAGAQFTFLFEKAAP
jgi:hypothetical protein